MKQNRNCKQTAVKNVNKNQMVPISVRWHFNHHKNAQNLSDQFPMNKGIVPAKYTAFFCGDNFMFFLQKNFSSSTYFPPLYFSRSSQRHFWNYKSSFE